MKVIGYAIYDTKAEFFQRPFFAQTDGLALRAVVDEGLRRGSELSKHPSDYIVFAIGEFDDASGTLNGFTPRNLGLVKQLISINNEASDSENRLEDPPDAQRDVA